MKIEPPITETYAAAAQAGTGTEVDGALQDLGDLVDIEDGVTECVEVAVRLLQGPKPREGCQKVAGAVLLALRFSRRLLVLMTNLTKSVLPSRVVEES